MNKTLVVLGVLCMATFAMAQVTQSFTPLAMTGIDGSGLHHTRGADSTIRFGKGTFNSGEMGVYQFNTTAIQSFINTNIGGQTNLVSAIANGQIAVSFSVVCSDNANGSGNGSSTVYGVGVADVYTNNNIIQGPGPASSGDGDDTNYNWTNSGWNLTDVTPYATATTMDSPADYYGAVMGGGDGQWNETDNGFTGQQFKNLPGTQNTGEYGSTGGTLMNLVNGQRSSVQLDDNLWAEYVYGVNSATGAASPYVTSMLKTYGTDAYDSSVNDNVCIYTTNNSDPTTWPELTVTITGATPPKYIHAHDGDANNDGKVDVVDLGILAKNYDKTGLPTSAVDPFGAGSWQSADFNNDGNVDVVDLGILAKNYDWVGSPAVPTPEPMTLSLVAVGALALIRRRK